MSDYIKEFSPIKDSVGNRIMTMLIEHSYRIKPVYFEVYEDDNNWRIYWNYGISPEVFLPIMKRYATPQMTLMDAMKNQTIINEIRKMELSYTYSKDLNENEVSLIKQLISKGFPELSKMKPQGLDGHHYIFTIGDDNTEYYCWCVIPEEWKHIDPIIDLFVDIAGLDDNYRIDGIA